MGRKLVIAGLVGSAVMLIAASFLAPALISWWYEPPGGPQLINCTPQVKWAMAKLLNFQIGFALGGLLVTPILGWAIFRKRMHPAPIAAAPAPVDPAKP